MKYSGKWRITEMDLAIAPNTFRRIQLKLPLTRKSFLSDEAFLLEHHRVL